MSKFEQQQGFPAEKNEAAPNPRLEIRDKHREYATAAQKRIGEIQGAKHEISLYQLMERSGDNVELVNAMNEFLRIRQEGRLWPIG